MKVKAESYTSLGVLKSPSLVTIKFTKILSQLRQMVFEIHSSQALTGGGVIIVVSPNILALTRFYTTLRDTFGYGTGNQWRPNYVKTIKCSTGIPYFFSDGSSLFANGDDNWGVPCPIVNPPDTFPGRHIIKLTPQGLWDSTFVPDANAAPQGFLPYDSNRIFIYGQPFKFTHYNGKRVNGLCRIYLDGTLDTTFTSPMSDSIANNFFYPNLVEKDGGFIITGDFLLKKYPHQYLHLVRCNADGSLDSTFMNLSGPKDTINTPNRAGTSPIAPTDDGGYIVGGYFNNYQGYAKNCIAKIDSNGKVEPQYFTSQGPDSASILGHVSLPSIDIILKSKFGGYYVAGSFLKWDGKPVQPIIRLKLVNTTGINENETANSKVKLYPNPTDGELSVAVKGKFDNQVLQFQLRNLLGQVVFKKQMSSAKSNFNLEMLGKGVFVYEIIHKDERIAVGKLVIQ